MGKNDVVLSEPFGNTAAGHAANNLDTATTLRERKLFATQAAHFALLGCELIKGDPSIEGQAPYFVARWGMGVQPLASLDAAQAYLVQLMDADDGAK